VKHVLVSAFWLAALAMGGGGCLFSVPEAQEGAYVCGTDDDCLPTYVCHPELRRCVSASAAGDPATPAGPPRTDAGAGGPTDAGANSQTDAGASTPNDAGMPAPWPDDAGGPHGAGDAGSAPVVDGGSNPGGGPDAGPPILFAADDVATTDEDTPVAIAVLDNDHSSLELPFTIDDWTSPSRGQVTLHASGALQYAPFTNISGVDEFTYTIRDEAGHRATATVSVTILATPDAPVVEPQTFYTTPGFPVSGLLAATDPDGEPLTFAVVAQPAGGMLALQSNGNFVYTPLEAGSTSPPDQTFTVTASDGTLTSSVATITIMLIDHRWVGGVSTDFAESTNWLPPTLPNAEVLIPDGAVRMPVVSSTLILERVIVAQAATLTLTETSNLQVKYLLVGPPLDANGRIEGPGRIRLYYGNGGISGRVGNLWIQTNYHLDDHTRVDGAIEFSDFGRLELRHHSLYLAGDALFPLTGSQTGLQMQYPDERITVEGDLIVTGQGRFSTEEHYEAGEIRVRGNVEQRLAPGVSPWPTLVFTGTRLVLDGDENQELFFESPGEALSRLDDVEIRDGADVTLTSDAYLTGDLDVRGMLVVESGHTLTVAGSLRLRPGSILVNNGEVRYGDQLLQDTGAQIWGNAPVEH
jgi:VCBS repeat-containing protein